MKIMPICIVILCVAFATFEIAIILRIHLKRNAWTPIFLTIAIACTLGVLVYSKSPMGIQAYRERYGTKRTLTVYASPAKQDVIFEHTGIFSFEINGKEQTITIYENGDTVVASIREYSGTISYTITEIE